MSYSEYYATQLHDGQEFQDFVADELYKSGISIGAYGSKKYQFEKGENRAGIEIKFDKKFQQTGNFWIELSEKSNPKRISYVQSGIYRDDNSWLYVIGNYETLYIFGKSMLRLLSGCGRYKHIENGTRTSVGFLLPKADADKYAVKIIRVSG